MGLRISKIEEDQGLKRKDFAKKLDFSAQYLTQLIRGSYNTPSKHFFRAMRDAFNVDEKWLETGEGEHYLKETRAPEIIIQPTIQIVPATTLLGEPDSSHFDQYIAVPLVEGRIAAGPGKSVSEDIESFVWVYRPEVGKRMHLVAVKLGDNERSMIPVLPPGAIVILDLDDKHLERRAIYGVRTEDGGCAVKRIHITQDTVLLLSENPEYGPEKAHTSDPEALIIGRVIWSWQSFVK